MKRDVIGLILLLVALVLLIWVIMAGTAEAHTTEEIEQWEIEWEGRLDDVAENLPLDPGSITQLLESRLHLQAPMSLRWLCPNPSSSSQWGWITLWGNRPWSW